MTFKYSMWVLRQYREPRVTGIAERSQMASFVFHQHNNH